MAAAAFALRTIWKAVLFPTTTAEGVAFSRYLLSDAGLLSEGIAKAFFPVKASFWTLHPSMRNFFFKVIPGGASHLATRTWFYDANFARLLKPDMQVVICGAGFDSRAYRLHAPRGVRFFEVDLPQHPGVQEYKAGRLARYGIVTDQVRLLPIDHKTQSLADVLKAGGHDPSKPTIFLAEGLTMYLTEESIADMVKSMRAVAAPGSYFMCELFDAYLLTEKGKEDPVLGKYWKIVSQSGEGYSFGVVPGEMDAFWKRLGVAEVLVHNNPQDQLDEWRQTPGTAAHDDGSMPHGGICHLFLLKIK